MTKILWQLPLMTSLSICRFFCYNLQIFLIVYFIALMTLVFSIPMTMKVNPAKTATKEKGTPSSLTSAVSTSKSIVPQLLRMTICKLLTFCFHPHFSYLYFHSIEITPPPTPSPVKGASGKKHALANCKSDDNEAFVPRYDIVPISFLFVCSDNFHKYSPTRVSPKKAWAKEPTTPSKISKSACQLVFDGPVYVSILIS